MTATASDQGNPPQQNSVRVKLIRTDKPNSLPPEWRPVGASQTPIDELVITLPENIAPEILEDYKFQVQPHGPDQGINFFIVRGRFAELNKNDEFVAVKSEDQENTMTIKVTGPLNYESTAEYILQMRASVGRQLSV